jgi:hypothetical protein
MAGDRENRRADRALVTASVLAAFAASGSDAVAAGVDRAPVRAWADVVGTARVPNTSPSVLIVLRAAPAAARRGAIGSPGPNEAAVRDQEAALAALATAGFHITVLRGFTKTVNGVEARVRNDERARLAHAAGVLGVFDVKTIVPASVSDAAARVLGASVHPVASGVAGDGDGVTIAVLDGPVDAGHVALRGRVARPLDASTAPYADGSAAHGTAVAAIAAGATGPAGAPGTARKASILSVEVLQQGEGGILSGTTADLIAGFEAAADPNHDGDLADRARVVLAAVAAPFAGFHDSAEARAVAGLGRIGAVVVAPAGNDGPTGSRFGTISSPGAAPEALTVGATDGRAVLPVVATSFEGGVVATPGEITLASTMAPVADTPIQLHAVAGFARSTRTIGADPADYAGPDGTSAVRGRAVLVPRDGGDLHGKIATAAAAGAAVVILYGGEGLPAGSLGVDDGGAIPVVGIDGALGLRISQALATGDPVIVRFGAARLPANRAHGAVAPFSSRGLGYGGLVKPDVVLPGVAIATARPGGGWRSVSGTSVAAAEAAGLVAAIAAQHPDWSAARLRSAVVSTARPIVAEDGSAPVESQGAGVPDALAANATTLTFGSTSLSLGTPDAAGRVAGTLVLSNDGDGNLTIGLGVQRDGADRAATLAVQAEPARFVLAAHATARVPVSMTVKGTLPVDGIVGGWLVASVDGARAQRLPFAITTPDRPIEPIANAWLGHSVFRADGGGHAATLMVRLGSVRAADDGSIRIGAVGSIAVDLYRGRDLVAHLYAAADLLPGRLRFAVRPYRAPGTIAPAGRYRFVLRASGIDGARSVRSYPITVH